MCNTAEPWKVEVEVLALSEISEESTHRRLFTHVWNQSRFENLEEGIISSDGRTLLLKFKLRYRGGETISKEHVITSAGGKYVDPGGVVEVWPLPDVEWVLAEAKRTDPGVLNRDDDDHPTPAS